MSQSIETPTGSLPEASRPSAKRWWRIAVAGVVAASLGTLAFVVANADSPVAESPVVSSAEALTPQQIGELRSEALVEYYAGQPQAIAELRAQAMVEHYAGQPQTIAELRAQAMVEHYSAQSSSGVTHSALDPFEERSGAVESQSKAGADDLATRSEVQAVTHSELDPFEAQLVSPQLQSAVGVETSSGPATRFEFESYPRPEFGGSQAEAPKYPTPEFR
ncbi:MAG: hypothetical protein ABFS21_02940 [Actinomycetota bacterium]